MKKSGTLNSQLSRIIAMMGHSDRIVICDCGLPIPRGAEVVDLALTPGYWALGEFHQPGTLRAANNVALGITH